ncbi:MAG: GNAT family N-acetyltransferase [Lachnospiraceae bacterium]|nr:GNAT family N-acetyltransferase [Lachnospiraceae bacterium]
MDISLKIPTTKYARDIEEFRREILEANDKDAFAGCFGLKECESVADWIKDVNKWRNAETCPQDHVPADVYIAVRNSDDRIVGVIDLRHHINNPVLRAWAGHIGYSVRPSERGKGYAKEMLRQNLLRAKELGLIQVMISCDHDNHASEKTILANGGVLEGEINVDGNVMKKYWILL